jgi:glycosyltransferase involved in cell wall biosynthesis
MRAAKQIYTADRQAVFLVVGEDRVAYGGDLKHVGGESFKEHVLAQDDYDLARVRFLGQVAPAALAEILGASDLHIYLTVPFVLSWSLLNAMASGCVVLASDTAPVREVVRDGENGLLRDFFDADGLAAAALRVLADREAHRDLGRAAAETVSRSYSLDVTLPSLTSYYEEVARSRPAGDDGRVTKPSQ